MDPDDELALGAVGLQPGDYRMTGFGDADLVIAIGYDLVEHAPRHWNPNKDKEIVCIDSVPAEIDEHFIPAAELVGDVSRSLERLTRKAERASPPPAPRACETPCASACAAPTTTRSRRCNHPGSSSSFGERSGSGTSSSRTSGSTSSGSAGCSPRTNRTRSSSRTAWPRWASPPGGHRHQAGPPRPQRGGGQRRRRVHDERAGARDRGSAGDRRRQRRLAGRRIRLHRVEAGEAVRRHFGTDFGNPDLGALRRVVRHPGLAVRHGPGLREALEEALAVDGPSLIAVPIDYSPDVAILEELGEEPTAT